MTLLITRTYGSERGDRGNPVPYRDHGVEEPMHVRTSSVGTWEVFIPPRQSNRGRRGKEDSVADDARNEEVG